MSMPAFRKQGGGTEDEFRKQSNSETAFNGLRNSIILDGALVENIVVYTTPTLVAHKLGRPIRGYIVVSNTGLTSVARIFTGTEDKSLFINLITSVNCTISLWVF